MATVIKELASICRHRLVGYAAALRACQGRGELHHAPPNILITGCSMKLGQIAESATAAVPMHSNTKVARRGGAIAHSAPAAQDLRFRKYSSHPIETATAEAIVSGQ